MGRVLAIAFVAAVCLAPACKMRGQVPQDTNLNKAPAPIVEPIRDGGARMADENKEKLKALVPVKEQQEQKAAEHADAGATPKKPPAKVKPNKEENPLHIDWSKLEIKLGPRGPEPKKEGRIH